LWSLSIEEQFYFLRPGVLKRWYRHRVAIVIGVLLVTPIWKAAMIYFKVGGGLGRFPLWRTIWRSVACSQYLRHVRPGSIPTGHSPWQWRR